MSAGLRAGYKQTEVGVIPEDWGVLPISTLTTEFRGGAPLKPSDFTTLGIKVLPKGGVGRTGVLRIADKDIQYCSRDYANAHPRNQVDKAYTIVVLRDLVPSGPSIGLMVEIGTDEQFVLAQGVYGFKVDSEKADAHYLIQLSNTRWYRNLANGIMVGSTQVHITNTAFKKAELPVPPLPEQRAIAAALGDVDALLDGLDRLIAKKQGLKVAAMQQLLTGKTRLPGFSGEWEVKRLEDCLVTRPDYGINAAAVAYSDRLPTYIRITDITDDGSFSPSPLVSVMHSEACQYYLKEGDLVFARTGASVGKSYLYRQADGALVFAGFLIRVQPDPRKLISAFLFGITQTNAYWNWVRQMSMRSGQPGINGNEYAQLPLALPSLPEQTAIAAVLSDMDTELAALQARRDKTQAVKRAMMQALLTGRIRLLATTPKP